MGDNPRMKRIRIFIQFLLFLVYFQFLISMRFYFRFMLVFVSVLQGSEVEYERGEFLQKQPQSTSYLVIEGSPLFLNFLFHALITK